MLRLLLSLVAALAMPAAVHAAARDLPVPAGKGWKHADTGLILRATLDGLPRTKLADLTDSEHDVIAEFADPGTVATVYLFHPAVDSVAMWFDRAQIQLESREVYGNVAPSSADPIPFASPGATAPDALRRVYAPGKGPYRATALAVMPLGEWLVAIRVSTGAMPPRELDARLTRIVVALGWPSAAPPAPPLAIIDACPAPTHFTTAKAAKPDMTDVILAGAFSVAAAKPDTAQPATPPHWCQDGEGAREWAVYHNLAGDTRGYTLALGDAGRAIHVSPSLDMQLGKGKRYTVTFVDVDGTSRFLQPFDGLPAPEQVIAALSGPSTGSAKGTSITINSDMVK